MTSPLRVIGADRLGSAFFSASESTGMANFAFASTRMGTGTIARAVICDLASAAVIASGAIFAEAPRSAMSASMSCPDMAP